MFQGVHEPQTVGDWKSFWENIPVLTLFWHLLSVFAMGIGWIFGLMPLWPFILEGRPGPEEFSVCVDSLEIPSWILLPLRSSESIVGDSACSYFINNLSKTSSTLSRHCSPIFCVTNGCGAPWVTDPVEHTLCSLQRLS